ncbi:MAG: tetratricopeptide repeat protein [Hylemonella sp.]|uniref:tetratricopeptide repeat protein n=1 Tax=Hylemonella sp. TaxID=2066020 RepID=UPI0022BEAD89|nr:tetratricopeptide repeat protein [Hylemonella sp.]MCZ8251857.1 tetratricopeptide repeat protein [Hylemonella sp.]
MSVINKMLRDLDARRGEARLPDLPQGAIPAAMDGTASVGTPAGQRARRWGLGLFVLLLGAGALAWYLHATQAVVPPPLQAVVPVAAPAAASAPVPEAAPQPAGPVQQHPSEPVAEPPSTPPAAAPSVSESQAAAEPAAPPRKPRRRSEAAETAPTPSATERPSNRSRPLREAEPAAPTSASVAPVAAEVPTPAAAQRRQSAAQETLAQAQSLWSAGSREAALQLVQDAVAVTERAQPVEATLLAQLVREQVRMELALGRPGPVLALLTRLEPSLSGQADLWAVRGNAAQRLGRHQEAVQAYLAALQLRPEEPRWMLGAAVSLAALGQLEAAARQAEQARALGPVSPEVLTYLRQAGVPMR